MRLFTGLALPPDATAALGAMTQTLRGVADLKWSSPEKLHITMAFIGDWPEARVDELVNVLAPVRAPAVEVRIRGLGWMPSPRHPRALYAGVEPTPEIESLAAETARVLRAVGVSLEDRIYRPHVTLARVRGRLKESIPLHDEPVASFMARSFHLYLSSDGKYTKLKEFSFATT